MVNGVIIELKLLDFFHSSSTSTISRECDPFNMPHLLQYLEEQLGGALCLTHYCLPELSSNISGEYQVIEIGCCCKHQSKIIEARIKEIFHAG